MHALRVLTLSDGHQVIIPDAARVVEVDGRTTLRIPPLPGFEDFADADGLVEVLDGLILDHARRGDFGLELVDVAVAVAVAVARPVIGGRSPSR